MAVGEKIREIRERRKLSQEELGRRLHRTGATISRYESGIMRIAADELPEFADALHCHPCDFFDNGGRDSQAARTAEFVRDWEQEEASRLARLRRIQAEISSLIEQEESA